MLEGAFHAHHRRHVEDDVRTVRNASDEGFVGRVSVDDFDRSSVRNVRPGPGREVVENRYLVSLRKSFGEMTADTSCTAGDEYVLLWIME